MRKLLVLFVAAVFLFSGLAIAAGPAPVTPAAPAAAKKTVMSVTGLVKELTDKILKLERKVKGKVQEMDFVLKSPVTDVKVGDVVKVNYVVEDGKNVVKRVKKVLPKEKGQAPAAPAAAPAAPGTTQAPAAPPAGPAAPGAPAAPAAK